MRSSSGTRLRFRNALPAGGNDRQLQHGLDFIEQLALCAFESGAALLFAHQREGRGKAPTDGSQCHFAVVDAPLPERCDPDGRKPDGIQLVREPPISRRAKRALPFIAKTVLPRMLRVSE